MTETDRSRLARQALAGILALLLPSLAHGFSDEPSGFADARFGMSVAQVRAIFPGMKVLGAGTGPLALAYHEVGDQVVDGLKPCAVTFGFAADKLYEIRFNCGNRSEVDSLLRRKFGAPSVADENGIVWQSEKTIVSLNPKVMTFAFADRALTQSVHQHILLQALGQGGQPALTPSPRAQKPQPEPDRTPRGGGS